MAPILYHWTRPQSVVSVCRWGLLPRYSSTQISRVWLAEHWRADELREHVGRHQGIDPAMLILCRCDCDGLKLLRCGRPGIWWTPDVIEPDRIVQIDVDAATDHEYHMRQVKRRRKGATHGKDR